jgi:membrane-bound lytic murein transglycosylase D
LSWTSLFQLIIVLALGSLLGCAAIREPASTPKHSVPSASPIERFQVSPSEINKIIEETNPVLSETSEDEKVPLHVPDGFNRRVSMWIRYYSERKPEMTRRYLERGEALRPHIEAILKERDVPKELFYLAMIESGFVLGAKSRAKAVGVWQFVEGTGKNYGLIVNREVDERKNWIKATESAAAYLKDLNNVFGNWYLALAAYNAGEHRIVRSIMKGKSRDFWALAEGDFLPQETMDYVPKFLAAQIVGRNYGRMGIVLNSDQAEQWEPWETVGVPSGTRLIDLSALTGVDIDVLKKWNRDLLKGITPVSKGGTVDIYMPKTEVAKFEAKKDEIAKLRIYGKSLERQRYASREAEGDANRAYAFYVVRRGDNIGSISKKTGTSARSLLKINGLRKWKIHPGQRLKYYKPSTPVDKNNNKPKKPTRGVASKEISDRLR